MNGRRKTHAHLLTWFALSVLAAGCLSPGKNNGELTGGSMGLGVKQVSVNPSSATVYPSDVFDLTALVYDTETGRPAPFVDVAFTVISNDATLILHPNVTTNSSGIAKVQAQAPAGWFDKTIQIAATAVGTSAKTVFTVTTYKNLPGNALIVKSIMNQGDAAFSDFSNEMVNVTAGVPFNLRVAIVDRFSNPIGAFNGTMKLLWLQAGAYNSLPWASNFATYNGQSFFWSNQAAFPAGGIAFNCVFINGLCDVAASIGAPGTFPFKLLNAAQNFITVISTDTASSSVSTNNAVLAANGITLETTATTLTVATQVNPTRSVLLADSAGLNPSSTTANAYWTSSDPASDGFPTIFTRSNAGAKSYYAAEVDVTGNLVGPANVTNWSLTYNTAPEGSSLPTFTPNIAGKLIDITPSKTGKWRVTVSATVGPSATASSRTYNYIVLPGDPTQIALKLHSSLGNSSQLSKDGLGSYIATAGQPFFLDVQAMDTNNNSLSDFTAVPSLGGGMTAGCVRITYLDQSNAIHDPNTLTAMTPASWPNIHYPWVSTSSKGTLYNMNATTVWAVFPAAFDPVTGKLKISAGEIAGILHKETLPLNDATSLRKVKFELIGYSYKNSVGTTIAGSGILADSTNCIDTNAAIATAPALATTTVNVEVQTGPPFRIHPFNYDEAPATGNISGNARYMCSFSTIDAVSGCFNVTANSANSFRYVANYVDLGGNIVANPLDIDGDGANSSAPRVFWRFNTSNNSCTDVVHFDNNGVTTNNNGYVSYPTTRGAFCNSSSTSPQTLGSVYDSFGTFISLNYTKSGIAGDNLIDSFSLFKDINGNGTLQTATSGSVVEKITVKFTVIPATATHIAWNNPPTTIANGACVALTMDVLDPYGNQSARTLRAETFSIQASNSNVAFFTGSTCQAGTQITATTRTSPTAGSYFQAGPPSSISASQQKVYVKRVVANATPGTPDVTITLDSYTGTPSGSASGLSAPAALPIQ